MIVISKEFWAVNEATRGVVQQFPDNVKGTLDKFNDYFIHHRVNRELIMLPNYGVVSLKLTFDNGSF
jgi:hypothetical protein